MCIPGEYQSSLNFVGARGLEHYMFGTPFAAIAQGLQVLGDCSKKKPDRNPAFSLKVRDTGLEPVTPTMSM